MSSTHEPRRGGTATTDRQYERRWSILIVVLLSQMMILIDATIINVALPSAQRALDLSDASRQWVITAYILAFGSLLPLGGRLADIVGRKRLFVVSLIGFGVFSALAGAAPNAEVLLISRVLQGVFAAALAPTAVSTIAVMFTDPAERNKAFAVFGAVAGSAGAIGLLLGGALTDHLDWRWTMYVNVAFAIPALVGALALMVQTVEANRPRLDILGTVLASGGLFLVVFGLSRAEVDGWTAGITVSSLVAGVILLVLFLVAQRLVDDPLIPLRVLANRNRGAAYLTLTLGNASLFAVFLFLTYYFQDILGYSPVRTGLAFLPLPLSIGVVATITQGTLLKRFDARQIIAGGLALAAVGAGLLTQADLSSNYASWILPGLILIGGGIGLSLVPAIAMGSVTEDPRDAGSAGGMNNVSQQIGAAVGVALISSIVANATSDYFGTHSAGPNVASSAALHGFGVGYWWAAGIFAVAAVCCGALIPARTRLDPEATVESIEDTIPAI